LQDRHIEPVFFIGSVGLGLIEPAMLGFREPVRRESDLVEGKRGGCYKSKSREEESETGFQCESSVGQCLIGSGHAHDSNNRGNGGGKFKFGLTPVSAALGRAGDGGEQDRAEHKANYADHRKDKTLPFGQALAFGTQFGS
jgi:hypothetical protein